MEWKMYFNSFLLTVFSQCLLSDAFGILRTGQTLFKPHNGYMRFADLHKGNFRYPSWHNIWKKLSVQKNRKDKNEIAEESILPDAGYKALKHSDKRFFQFSPFVTQSNTLDRINSIHQQENLLKSTYVNNHKTFEGLFPFVDHFSGIRSFALHFYRPTSEVEKPINSNASPDLKDDEIGRVDVGPETELELNNDQSSLLSGISTRRSSMPKQIDSSFAAKELSPSSGKQHETGLWGFVNSKVQTEDKSMPEGDNNLLDPYLPDQETGNHFEFKSGSTTEGEQNSVKAYDEDRSIEGGDNDDTTSELKGHFSEQNWYGTGVSDTYPDYAYDINPVFNFGGFGDTSLHTQSDQASSDEISTYDAEYDFGLYDQFYGDSQDGVSSFGSFSTNTDDCEGIDERKCTYNSECSCYGVYTCNNGRCVTTDSIEEVTQNSDGIWHEEPVYFPQFD